eukprot:3568487-Amphidinium_carterae.1
MVRPHRQDTILHFTLMLHEWDFDRTVPKAAVAYPAPPLEVADDEASNALSGLTNTCKYC